MKRLTVLLLAAALALCCLFGSASLALAVNVGTSVTFRLYSSFEITSRTEDLALGVGESEQLAVTASLEVQTYLWEVSSDGGVTWVPAPGVQDKETYDLTNAQANKDAEGRDIPYQYRVTVTSAEGAEASAIISVLVSDDYHYRNISLRNGDTDVSSYMHDRTRLVVTPPDEEAAQVLKAELSPGCLPLILCDVSLINQNDQAAPFFGALKVDFHVGAAYDGQSLNVFHLRGDDVLEYSGEVTNGILSIDADALSPFMVEVPSANTRTITVSADAGGSVTPSGDVRVADGGTKTFTFLPNAGYEVSAVKADDASVTFTGNSYTLSDIKSDHTLNVSFRQVMPSDTLHTVTITGDENGTVSPSDEILVRHGSAQTFYFYPTTGYALDTLLINDVAVSVIGSSYTISAVTASTTVSATFSPSAAQPPNVYKVVTASSGAGGSISPGGEVRVEYGGGMYFYYIPDTGNEPDTITIDGTEQEATANSYHFENVIDTHTIHASFKPAAPPPTPKPTPPLIPPEPPTPTPTAPPVTPPVTEPWVNPFTDVGEKDWFYDAVEYCSENGLMDGVSATEFKPEGIVSRAEVWQVLANLAGIETETSKSPWYTDAQAWAVSVEITDGTNPTAEVTREQLITMLYRYYTLIAKGEFAGGMSAQEFDDFEDVSKWAEIAVQWGVTDGIIEGVGGNMLNPDGEASRAELAAMLMRFNKLLNK